MYENTTVKAVSLRTGNHYRWRPVNRNVTEMRHASGALLRIQPARSGGYVAHVSDNAGAWMQTVSLEAADAGSAEQAAIDHADALFA